MSVPRLTPYQELLVEVLIARHRLGHHTWTMARNAQTTKALKNLEQHGLVNWKPGVVENTYLARLTETGKTAYMTNPYTAPILGGQP